jgi:hypothetical protein
MAPTDIFTVVKQRVQVDNIKFAYMSLADMKFVFLFLFLLLLPLLLLFSFRQRCADMMFLYMRLTTAFQWDQR